MRSIGKLNTAPEASTFGDYLYSKGIESQIEQEDDGTFSVWILDDDRMVEAGELLKLYIANPNSDELGKISRIAQKRRADEEKAEARKRSVVATEERVMYEKTTRYAAPVTLTLIALSLLATIFSDVFKNETVTNWFFFEPDQIMRGQVWRLVSPIFLHFEVFGVPLLHLAFNMFWLLNLGTTIEQKKGKWYLLLLVLAIGVLSNATQYYWTVFYNGTYLWAYRFGGMSGVVYGLFGFIWMRSKFDRYPTFDIDRNSVWAMVGWLFLGMTGFLGPIANGAHVGGLLAGMAWGYWRRSR